MTRGDKERLGVCRSVTITCISEVGWHDTDRLLADIKGGGGSDASQWDKPWQASNAAGSAALIEVELLTGARHKFLLDCGWNEAYMQGRFEATGVDGMLARGEIEFLFLSHEHLDHLWGLQAVLHYRPDLPLRVPPGFTEEALAFIRGERSAPTSTDRVPPVRHTGPILVTPPDRPTVLYPGCVAVVFDLPILLGIRGEQSLYFRVQDQGTVCVTGCCHQTVTTLADYALTHIATESTLYGLYGGLHIAPFDPSLSPAQERTIADLGRFGFRKIAANHCTGVPAVERMIALGYPVVRGSGRYGSASPLMLGNGDRVVFD
ncbi:hypothetical protein [Candidatus Thiosymbion oneisti]|uniref:hypothetical protein n=1 Tax=Candidatus Thiosymbion oneisti TaxID=589554 RepID=UPI000B7CA49A|nr:hypothetical protein [Candidatus Thiosymbion oneisti]